MKRPRSTSPLPSTSKHEANSPELKSPQKSKKLKLHNTYTEESPFPTFLRPTAVEAQEVHAILAKEHPNYAAHRRTPKDLDTKTTLQGCGNAPNVIEALIETILSQNTTARNSSGAKTNLDAAFGRNNFAKIAAAPREEVVTAIRQGGLANKKAATIQNILNSVFAKHGAYSLQHLAATEDDARMSDEAIMEELVSYSGVGPKTASCVLLFCIGRDSFAVDTHVFRLSRLLGWVPDKADRILAQAHLEHRVPGELKYGLHVLMVQHGRACSGCKKSGFGSGSGCVLRGYLKARKDSNMVKQE